MQIVSGVTFTPSRARAFTVQAPISEPILSSVPFSVAGVPTVGISSRVRNMPNDAMGIFSFRMLKFETSILSFVPITSFDVVARQRPLRFTDSLFSPSTAITLSVPVQPPVMR